MNNDSTQNGPLENRAEELDNIVDLVCLDLKGKIPREVVYRTVSALYGNYDGATVRSFISVFVRRNAKEALTNGSNDIH